MEYEFDPAVAALVTTQINLDEGAARLYAGIASWADAESYHGLKGWARASMKAHRHQVHEFVKYAEDRMLVEYGDLGGVASEFASYLAALAEAASVEALIIGNLQQLSDVAREHQDEATAHVAGHYLHRFETRQASVIADAQLVVARDDGVLDLLDASVLWR